MGPANGWLTRARRLADRRSEDCVEAGYMLLPLVFEQEASGDWDAAARTAAEARSRGELLRDADLCALAGHEQGHIHVRQGRSRTACVCSTRRWSPPAAESCRRSSPGSSTAESSSRARRRTTCVAPRSGPRRSASAHGREPQPGLALLRLAQGRSDAAAAGIARLAAEANEPTRRAGVLPAYVQIMIARGDADAARDASAELDRLARDFGTSALRATAALARGAVLLADGDSPAALRELRAAMDTWQELAAPYEAARARELIGVACRALGDHDAAALELAAGHATFASVGAAIDRDRVQAHLAPTAAPDRHGLTARELEVLGLVAAGKSNRDIAAALVISEHTVARHPEHLRQARRRLAHRGRCLRVRARPPGRAAW